MGGETVGMEVVLASASPRRRELLGKLIRGFSVQVSDVDEDALTVADPWETAMRLAFAKATAVRRPGTLTIGSDTVVALPEGVQLAKPADPSHAIRMLQSLSGRTHAVITGVCLAHEQESHVFQVTSEVSFRPLSLSEIEHYVRTGEPMDKAGAYAIQGGAAGFVSNLSGSMTNVIGLPLERLAEELPRLFGGRVLPIRPDWSIG